MFQPLVSPAQKGKGLNPHFFLLGWLFKAIIVSNENHIKPGKRCPKVRPEQQAISRNNVIFCFAFVLADEYIASVLLPQTKKIPASFQSSNPMMLATVLFCLVLCTAPMLAQLAQPIKLPTAHVRFERINTANGLSNNEITCIFQDRDGFMWFGTADGLNKYDGYTMTVFRSDDKKPERTLPNNRINAITQDDLGNIWIATNLGVSVIDYHTHVMSRFPKGLKDSTGKPFEYRAVAVHADPFGNMWVHGAGGLFRVNPRTYRRVMYVHKNVHYSKDSLKKFHLDPDSVIKTTYHPTEILYHNGSGNDKNFYFCGGDHRAMIMRYDTAKKDFVPFSYDYCPSRPINALADDGENFWFLSEMQFPGEKAISNRLVILNKTTKKVAFQPMSGTPFAACVVGDEIWFGVFRSGIRRFNRFTKQYIGDYRMSPADAGSLPDNNVESLTTDRTGTVWIGTVEGGIARLVPNPITILRHNVLDSASLPSNNVLSVLEDSTGTLWIGTRKSLCALDRTTGRVQSYPRTHPTRPSHINEITSLCLERSRAHPERNKRLWLGSWGMGLQLFDIEKRKFMRNPMPVRGDWAGFPIPGWVSAVIQIAPDSLCCINWGNSYWTLDLSRIDGLDTTIKKADIYPIFKHQNGMKLYADILWGYLNTVLIQDRAGTLWSGGEGSGEGKISGLFRKKHGENWTLIAKPNKSDTNSLPTDIIYAIYESTRGDLWLGTADGLCRFDRQTLKVRRFALPNNVVNTLQEDAHGNLWCGTAKGLVQFNPDKEAVMRVLRPIDGLPSWSFNSGASMKSLRTGELFLGTSEGLCWFHPDSLTVPMIKPLVAFSNFALIRENSTDSALAVQAGTAHFAGGVIELSHRDKGFSFEMAALDFKSPADNEYAYKLDGFDKDWNNAGNRRFASYTSLPDGEYTLRIKAANADGVWNEAATTLRIRVRPPFWRTWWFLSLGVIAMIGSTASTTRFVLRRRLETRLAKERLEQQIERERLEKALELERERRRISQDIHDEVGSGLTKILMLTQNATETAQPNKEISTTAQGVIDGMQEIIWSINPKNDTLQSLVAFIRSYGREFVSAAGMNVIVETPEDLTATPLRTDVRRNVFLAVKESLNNAVKYSAATEIRIILAVEPSSYIFTIADNGRGFIPDVERLPTMRGGNGLENIRLRMEEIGGSFHLDSVPNEGTKIELEIPR